MIDSIRRQKKQITNKRKLLAIREYLNSVKSSGCQLCGYNKCLSAIEFHHIGNDKLFELSKCSARSFDTIKKEISKCVVVCANCHRELHASDIGKIDRVVKSKEEDQLLLSI